MKFITDDKELSNTFVQLCNSYRKYKWAVAWAGEVNGFDLANVLEKNKSRMDKVVIGLHFYQTAPSFIERYIKNDKVKFISQTDGTFHSKVYLFFNSNEDWCVLVGSSNFTNSGFHKNNEANMLFSNMDEGNDMFAQISEYIDELWNQAEYLSNKELIAYKESCRYQKRHLKSLCSLSAVSKKEKMTSAIDVKTWGDYLREVYSQDKHDTSERVRLLSKAQELFKEYPHFDDMPLNVRKCLAGFASTMEGLDGEPINWKFFGSLKGAGVYKHAIIENIRIGKALDAIPLSGPISKQQFEEYCQAFKGWINPLACATRLLAIKRPDWFVCIDSKNLRELSLMMKIPQSHFTLSTYWEEVVVRIQECSWYSDDSKKEDYLESEIWNYRVAMLDCLCYKED